MRHSLRLFTLAGLISFAFLLPACLTDQASKVSDQSIFTNYSIFYDDNDHSLTAEAIFTTQQANPSGGTDIVYIELDKNSAITFDGSPMAETKNLVNQIVYRSTLQNIPVNRTFDEHNFQYRTTKGELFTNKAVVPPIVAAQYPSTPFSLSGISVVGWMTTDSIGKDFLSLEMADHYPNWREVATGSANDPNQVNGTLAVKGDEMTGLMVGTVLSRICRNNLVAVSAAPAAGGSLQSSFCSKSTSLQIQQ